MGAVEIYQWLETQGYQTAYEETGAYKMYYGIDMPTILEDYRSECEREQKQKLITQLNLQKLDIYRVSKMLKESSKETWIAAKGNEDGWKEWYDKKCKQNLNK